MADIPPPPPPPPPPDHGGQGPGPARLEPVGAWPRLGARFIDGLVLLIPNVIIVSIIGGGSAFAGGSGSRMWFAGVVTTLVTFGYYVWLESSRGQTVGKKVLGYRTVGPGGGNPTTEQASRRNLWVLAGILPGALGGLATGVIAIVIAVGISNDPFNRGWHDNHAGGTAVVRAR